MRKLLFVKLFILYVIVAIVAINFGNWLTELRYVHKMTISGKTIIMFTYYFLTSLIATKFIVSYKETTSKIKVGNTALIFIGSLISLLLFTSFLFGILWLWVMSMWTA
jgi:hypothetical protein